MRQSVHCPTWDPGWIGKVLHLACGESDGGAEERMVTTTELTLGKTSPKSPKNTEEGGEVSQDSGGRGGDREGLKQTKLEGVKGENYYGINRWVGKLEGMNL